MKTIIFALLMVLCVPAMAFSGQWDGSIQGLTCALHGKVCPSGMEDPYIAVEDNFVLLTGDDTWFLLPNLNEDILVRYLNEPVRVIGTKNAKHNAITVEKLQAKKNGEWKTIWSEDLEKDVRNLIQTWGGF